MTIKYEKWEKKVFPCYQIEYYDTVLCVDGNFRFPSNPSCEPLLLMREENAEKLVRLMPVRIRERIRVTEAN